MGVDIDRKLCLTAALLGAVSRKDLAAAFRRVNQHAEEAGGHAGAPSAVPD